MNALRLSRAQLDGITGTDWELLASKKIFFGHQSVGRNIIDGIEAILPAYPALHLNIHDTVDLSDFGGPVFAHFPIGQNMDPKSKIDDFKSILAGGIGQAADIALFKFCFVDVNRRTDIESLFRYFEKSITGLEQRFPKLRIVTFTVPLTNMPRGIKPLVKRILGMMPPHHEDNKARSLFNAKLRARFAGNVFDLAEAESRRSDGMKVAFQDGEGTYELMNPNYTDDGGHLNVIGRQVVAANLLAFLVRQDKE
jgi:hypothetical protein